MTDVDSICGAIAYAYCRTYAHNPAIIHIPLCNIPFADVALRTELAPVFKRCGIKDYDLITLSDLPAPHECATKLPASNTRWILFDHNCLTGVLGKIYSSSVVGCLDHHEDEKSVPEDCKPEPRKIERCGSCTSLVVNSRRALQEPPSEDTSARVVWHKDWAYLCLGPILIDTQALTSEHKVTPNDTAAVEYLEKILKAVGDDKYDRQAYYEEINKAKENIDHLGIYDILRKDFKMWTETTKDSSELNIGISSTVKPLSFIINKAYRTKNFCDHLDGFASERNLHLAAIMTSFTDVNGEFARELFVLGRGKMARRALERFEEKNWRPLGLEMMNIGLSEVEDDEWRRAWVQKSTKDSRKQVAPLLRASAL